MAEGEVIDLGQERRKRGPRFNGSLMEILEVAHDLVCVCRSGWVKAINGAGLRMLGARSRDDILDHRLSQFALPEYRAALEVMATHAPNEDPLLIRMVAWDGTVTDVEMEVFRAREIAYDAVVVVGRETGGSRARKAGPTSVADTLTGALTRQQFLDVAARECERARLLGLHLSVIVLDMDHAKRINHSLGQAAGDDAIRALAQACRDGLPPSARLGRLEGDAFGVLLPDTGADAVWSLAERLRQRVEKLDGTAAFTCSLGAALLAEADAGAEQLLYRAEQALERAKALGRNRVERGD